MASTPSPLTDPAGAHVRALDATRKFVAAAMSSGKLDAPTPCGDWNVQQLIEHIVGGEVGIATMFGVSEQSDAGGGSDLLAAFDASAAGAKAAWATEGAMSRECDLGWTKMSGTDYARMMFLDVLIHGWDLAKGIGADPTLDAGLVELAYGDVATREDAIRANPAYGGGKVPDPGAAAGPQARLLAAFGREANWGATAAATPRRRAWWERLIGRR